MERNRSMNGLSRLLAIIFSFSLMACSEKPKETQKTFKSKLKIQSFVSNIRAEDEVFLDDLALYIRNEIETGYYIGNNISPLFDSNYDWHSAVHAHWSLLRIARATASVSDRNEEHAQFINSRLTTEALLEDLEFIQNLNPEGAILFEMPYGRAWYLQLAREFYHWADEGGAEDKERIFPMADVVADSMLDHYADLELRHYFLDPNQFEYVNPSWAYMQLYLYFELRGDSEKLAIVNNLIGEMLLNHNMDMNFSSDTYINSYEENQASGFFSAFGNFTFLLAKAEKNEELQALLNENSISNESIQAIDLTAYDLIRHDSPTWSGSFTGTWAGLVANSCSRAWGLKALSEKAELQSDKDRFSGAYISHLEQLKHAHSFTGKIYSESSYSHYVPQFITFAMTEEISVEIEDLDPPEIQIISPAEGQKVSGEVIVEVRAQDNTSVSSIELFIGGVLQSSIGDSTALSFKWNTLSLRNGFYVLKVVAKDFSGNEGLKEITVNVDNYIEPPKTSTTTVLPPVPPVVIELQVSKRKLRKGFTEFSLNWSGATTETVDIYKNGIKHLSSPNDGSFSEQLKGKKPRSYKVCEAGRSTCSKTVITGY